MRRRLVTKDRKVVGLDLSLRQAAACAIPFNWEQDIRNVTMGIFGYELDEDATEREKIERLAQIAHDVSVFCVNHKAHRIAAESYAFSAQSSSVTKLAELGGVVRVDVLETMNIAIETITASRARKILLQNCPSRDSKKFAVRNIKRLGGPAKHWTEDECDAFCIANALIMHAGGTAMTFEGVY